MDLSEHRLAPAQQAHRVSFNGSALYGTMQLEGQRLDGTRQSRSLGCAAQYRVYRFGRQENLGSILRPTRTKVKRSSHARGRERGQPKRVASSTIEPGDAPLAHVVDLRRKPLRFFARLPNRLLG